MSERQIRDITPEYDEYSVAALLQEYARKTAANRAAAAGNPAPPTEEKTNAPAPQVRPAAAEPVSAAPKAVDPPAGDAASIAERSRRAAMSTLGETLRHYQQEAQAHREEAPQPEAAPSAPVREGAPAEEDAIAQDASPQAPSAPPDETENDSREQRPRVVIGEDGIITLRYKDNAAEEAPQKEPEIPVKKPRPERTQRPVQTQEPPRQSFTERFLAPAVRMVATRIARRQMQTAEAANWPEPLDIRETPELTPGKAAKYYGSLLRPLSMRLRVALLLTVILAWISLRLPMAGMLGRSIPLQAGVSLVLLLAVMMTALDVVTAGLRQLFDLKPGAEALASIAAILSGIDAVLVLFELVDTLPFCAIGAASLTAALWGEQLTCKALRRTFRTAAASKTPSVLSSGADQALLRTERDSTEGIVRRSESQDICRTAYAAAAPFLLGASLLLSVIACIGNGAYFLHTFSALVSVSASFAAFVGFPLPYAIAARRLRSSGAALAGYDGCADIGRTNRVVITDEDLFPPGTMKFSEINVAEGVFLGKVVASTAGLLSASGSGVSALFDELVSRRGYNMPGVEEFAVHEGGGLSGLISGERVLVGSAGFMNLMGIRLPQNLQTRNSICTAISGELVGVFVIDYIPVTSVQEALVTLMRGKTQTVFAIRDFNITPRMIGKLFRMPTDRFNFPSFRERYRLREEAAEGGDTPIDAVISRPGMLPLVEAAEAARKAYNASRISAILSLAGAGIGMVIMFLLCRVGAFDTASAGNVLSFMALWFLPALILSLGQSR